MIKIGSMWRSPNNGVIYKVFSIDATAGIVECKLRGSSFDTRLIEISKFIWLVQEGWLVEYIDPKDMLKDRLK